jgi:non-ribosomal peptide synthase protein (TIGR01720 family)
VSVALSPADTTALLQDVHRAYQTHIDDVLLTALAQAFACWTGESGLLIDLEGHGREEIVEGVDVSRTLGWFTTLFPVLVQPGHAVSPGRALMAVKEQLRRIPNRGIGYGVLRYLSQESQISETLQALPQAQVCWNYLGRVEQVVSGPVFWGPIREASGPSRTLQGGRRYLFEINGRLVGDQLQCEWTYSKHLYQRDTIVALARNFIEALHALIVHCQSPEAGGFTPSDFPNMTLTQPELDELLTALGELTDRA